MIVATGSSAEVGSVIRMIEATHEDAVSRLRLSNKGHEVTRAGHQLDLGI